jgi:DNA-binding response OmpR family regulator
MCSDSLHRVVAVRLPPLRVIVADDERDTVATLMVLLQHEGHEVRAVYKGSEVLRTVLAFDPDAVLLDIGLPEVSGHEVARKIRECRGSERPLLVGMSGRYKHRADRVLAEINGFNHYLIKPYRPEALIKLLAALKSVASA